ncbi:YcjF family protein [Allochromatium tepidum]|uniref:Kinase n=1 Tax=Allochromatium tepidum TaxID=553982 RepID=A0ABN6GCD3_9GAMM|nr:GTPase [Allochromatium tepidum]BCU07605.1 kinase [Allochromatium tepidum]
MAKTGRRRRLTEALLNPRVDDGALESTLASARERLPLPLIWLIGKTQSGKTSIIRALTGSPAAEIGNGFQPCTRSSRIYDFPAEAPVVRFLDTRGLGEVDYDPEEDIRFGESLAHLLLVVMKAGDLDQEAVLEVVRAVRRRHPEWPLVIAQTTLHEGYPSDFEHPQPYPFGTEPWPASLPPDLTRALRAQRDRAGDLPGRAPVRWVPVDLTLPEDGYAPADYGLEALWEAIDTLSTLPLRHLLGRDPDVLDLFERAAHPHIVGYALAAAGVGALPVVDLAGVPAIQAKMLQSLAALHAQTWDRRTILEFLGLLGTGVGIAYGTRMAGRTLIKLVPYLGQTLGAVWGASASGATTFALGKAAAYYLRRRNLGLSTEARALRRVFADQITQGARLLRDSR